MPTFIPPCDGDMPAEIDFSNGLRGLYFSPQNSHALPVHLDSSLYARLDDAARLRGSTVDAFVNELLKRSLAAGNRGTTTVQGDGR